MENKENKGGSEVTETENKGEKEQSGLLVKSDSVKKEKEGIYRYIDVRIISLFILGILLGFAIKTQTTKTIVIGSNDPKLEKTRGDYMLSKIVKEEVASELTEDGAMVDDESQEDVSADTTGELETETTKEE